MATLTPEQIIIVETMLNQAGGVQELINAQAEARDDVIAILNVHTSFTSNSEIWGAVTDIKVRMKAAANAMVALLS